MLIMSSRQRKACVAAPPDRSESLAAKGNFAAGRLLTLPVRDLTIRRLCPRRGTQAVNGGRL
jgi:hypothetical protein